MNASTKTTRRLILGALTLSPVLLALDAAGEEPAAPQCASDEDEAMRLTLNYVEVSPHGAEKDCRNCEFWFAGETGTACGGCTLIAGSIDPLGYCDSWALTSAPADALIAPDVPTP